MISSFRSVVVAACIVPVLLASGMVADVQTRYLERIDSEMVESSPREAILILGASVKPNGTPSDALRDRLDEGFELYQAGKGRVIVLTGDDGAFRSDEIDVMRSYLEAKGIPEDTLRIDGKGYRTYESCRNAKTAGIQTAILVTQRFHIARALYICNLLGVDAVAKASDRQMYQRIVYFWLRDLAASVKAWWDVHIDTPTSPVAA